MEVQVNGSRMHKHRTLDYDANMEVAMDLKRTDVLIKPNNARVLVRPFEFADSQRAFRIVARVMSLAEEEVDRLVTDLFTEFHGRHQKARAIHTSSIRVRAPILADRCAGQRKPAAAYRGLLYAGIRAGVGGTVQPVDGLASGSIGRCRPVQSDSFSACARRAKAMFPRSRSVPVSSTAIAKSCSTPRRGS